MSVNFDLLLRFLQCPETGEALSRAPDDLIASLNAKISTRTLVNRAGLTVEKPLSGGLIRASGAWLYPIVEEIPNLLADEAIPLR